MLKRRLAVLLVVITLVFVGCSAKQESTETANGDTQKVLRIGMATDVMSFDMANYVASNDLVPGYWVYDTLVRLDENQEAVPWLAESWEQISDTEWEFCLRNDVTFIDGTPMNAEAVKFCLERASVTARAASYSGFIDTIDVIDEFTIVLNTDQPFAATLNNLSNPINCIFSPSAYEENGGDEWMVNNPVGSGPYKCVEFVINDHSCYELNENYWGEMPAIDRIEVYVIPEESTRLIALQQGEVDLIYAPSPNEFANIEADPNLSMIVSPRARSVYIGLNAASNELKDENLRYAIQLAIDPDAIVESILEGQQRTIGGNGLLPVEVCESPFTIGEGYNPEKAKEVLAQSSYKGEPVQFWSPENRYMRDSQVAQVIQQQLTEVGINADLQIIEFGTLTSSLGAGGNIMCLYGWGFTTLEPYTGTNQLLSSESVFNYYGFNDAEADAMMQEAAEMTDATEIAKIYSEISRRAIEDEHCILPLYFMNNSYASTSKLTGVWIMPNELIDVMKADFVE
jgi:ABC-type transport system substrate-binding protein